MPKKKTAKKTATRKPRADAQTADLLGTDDYSAVKRVAIDELVPDPNNARKHSPENLRAIAESLKDLGQYRPAIVNARNNQVVVGNGMLEAARSIGWQSLEVRFVELTDEQQRKLSIVDNRTAEVGVAWDEELLAAQLADLHGDNPDLADALLLDELLKVVDGATEHVEFEAGQGDNEVPEPPENPITQPGDLWLLGKHRLLCGDCRDANAWKRLLSGKQINVCMTSPPYASQRKYDESSGFKPIKPDDYVAWWEPLQACVKANLTADGSFFVNIKPSAEGLDTELYVFDLVCTMARKWGWHFATEFCWQRTGIPQQVVRRFKNQFEPVYQFTIAEWKFRPEAVRHASDNVPIAQGPGAGDTNAAKRQGRLSAVEGNEVAPGLAYPGNRLPTFAETHEALGHSAAFPVGLPSFFIRAFSDESDNIADPFLGSGTTLIAAEQLGRKCYGMEISPAYCDVIVRRWEKLTGEKADREPARA